MEVVELKFEKEKIYSEVMMLSSYNGAKRVEENAFDIISLAEENEEILDRFFEESKAVLFDKFSSDIDFERFSEIEQTEGSFVVPMKLHSPLKAVSVKANLHSYFVNSLLSKWYMITNKDEASTYITIANDWLEKAKDIVILRITKRKVKPF